MSRANKEKERKERARQYKAGIKAYDVTKLTAYHEAGHVVFSTLFGPGVEVVTIDIDKVEELTGQRYPGYTRYSEGGYGDSDTVTMMTIVGLTAEALLVSGGVINSKEDDLVRFDDILENQMGLHGEAKNREMIRVRLMTQEFVTSHTPMIAAVAEALVERKTLLGAEVKGIVDGKRVKD